MEPIDAYQYAKSLVETAEDLISDMTSFTVQDIADILRDASEFIAAQAAEFRDYQNLTKVTLTVGNEVLDMTTEILPMINTTLLQEWVRDAVRARLNGGFGHGHDHTH
jgi:hypothetical protein